MTMFASLQLAKRVLFETDKRLLWKLVYNMGLKGALSVHKHKRRTAPRPVLPAVPLRLDHQHLQPALPGVLGRCEHETADDFARGLPQARPRSAGRWATSSSASSAASRSCIHTCSTCSPSTRTATSRSSPTATSSRPSGATNVATRQRHAANLRRRDRDRLATSVAAGRTCSRRRCRGCTTHSTAGVFTGVCTSLCADQYRRHAYEKSGSTN